MVNFYYILLTTKIDYREFLIQYYSFYKSLLECFNQSNVVAGGCCGSTKKLTIVGGWAWAWWLVTDVQYLSLEVSVYIHYSPATCKNNWLLLAAGSCRT